MTVFADSSALVKLYADEPGSGVMRSLEVLAVSVLARVDVPAALWRKVRIGELEPLYAGLLVADFEADWYGDDAAGDARFAATRVGAEVLESAARLTAAHGLKAYDAVQLSSALVARAAAPELTSFACFDRDLSAAAAAEGFAALPES